MKRKLKRVVPLVVLTVVFILAAAPQPATAYSPSTHWDIIDRACELFNTTLGLSLPNFCSQTVDYVNLICCGSDYADDPTRNDYRNLHYMNPYFHWGYLVISTSAGWCADYGLDMAVEALEHNTGRQPWWWVGFALHHVQDLACPPHTDAETLGAGWHGRYEDYCRDYCLGNSYFVDSMDGAILTFESWTDSYGLHCNASKAFGWVDYAAHQSVAVFVDARNGLFHEAMDVMIPLAVKLSVGFLLFSYHTLYPTSDVDLDGLTYLQEVRIGTQPWSSDTDGDNVPDNLDDADGDIMPNYWEFKYGLNPIVNDGSLDKDKDGLNNVNECLRGTNPTKADTDGDGLNDYQEVCIHHTNPNLRDTDADLMPDGWEVTYGLSATNSSDAGGDLDNDEVTNVIECLNVANPKKSDTDGDGLSDYQEIFVHHTYPNLVDSDGDGWSDSYEIAHGYNPMDPSDPVTTPDPPPGPILDP